CKELRLERLNPAGALLVLNGHARVTGWQTAAAHRARFEAYGEIARRVPLYAAEIPWGPPFQASLAPALLRCLKTDDRTP
ncbi:MAG TPA: hypothetical protein VK689_14595, partial [Armatimonadota bacterium]|nr:hypothetical protein [Armatimonadota bacterium]